LFSYEFQIRTYGFGDLAQPYFSHIAKASASSMSTGGGWGLELGCPIARRVKHVGLAFGYNQWKVPEGQLSFALGYSFAGKVELNQEPPAVKNALTYNGSAIIGIYF
jgi:hypothetical protein